MKEEKDYIQDIAEIRSMMERSSRFLSLSGWAGIMAGIYALTASYVAWKVFDFNPVEIEATPGESAGSTAAFTKVIFLAISTLVLALGTAIYFSYKKAHKRNENLWNATSRRLLAYMAVPFVAGGALILISISKGLISLVSPFALIFYGLALFNAGKFTYKEVKILGLVEIALGLFSAYFVDYGLLFWAIGFGIAHIIYGIYMHYRYER